MNTAEFLAERDRIVRVLIARRKELGLSRHELDRAMCKWDRRMVTRWETGKADPTFHHFLLWCHVLGLKVTIDAAD